MDTHRSRSVAGKRRALVVGGGFAGVEAATDLARDGGFEVTLVSDRDFLWLYPTSIWIPTREMAFEGAQVSLAEIAGKHGFELVIDSVQAVRSADNRVIGAAAEYEYDYLVLAMGAAKLRPAGVEHTLSICGAPEVSLEIRDRLDALIERGSGHIAVGFGGNPKDPSGVRGGPAFELLFNIHDLLRKKKLRDRFRLTFFAPMAQPGARMGDRALDMMDVMFERSQLQRRTGTKIAGFDKQGVTFWNDTRIDADLVLFIPGVTGHPVMADSDLPLNEAGFVRIDDHCLVEGTDNVYAAGDVAALEGPDWRAKQGHTAEVMARNAAHNIAAHAAGKPDRKGYQAHLSILCVMDTGNGAAFVYRGRKHQLMLPLPIVGHWMKKGWGTYARLTKRGVIPHLPGI
jgi:sulfide:quinone oxidoreductase